METTHEHVSIFEPEMRMLCFTYVLNKKKSISAFFKTEHNTI